MTDVNDGRAKRNVAVLVAAQAILGSQMPMIFVFGGLAGSMLTPNPCLATLPISMVVFGSMTAAPWISPLMQRKGRKFGFFVGAVGGAIGAAVAAWGLMTGSFLLFLLGSYLTGIYMSAQGFYRFAATDVASESYRPKAVSYVMAGGLLSAVFGPQLNKLVSDVTVLPLIGDVLPPIPFLGTYITVVGLNLGGMFLFLLLDLPEGDGKTPSQVAMPAGRSRMDLLRNPTILVAVICAMVAYALMNLVMTSTPLAVVGCGFTTDNANDIVSAHVLAMFAPSFFTGHLIKRFGVTIIMSLGLGLLALAGLVALMGVELENFFLALMLLGIGWNFAFIGATTLLAGAHAPHERGRAQGLNDMMVFGCVTLASLASGGLMNCSGSSAADGWSAVNLAMVPLLALAAGSLIWLSMRNRDTAA
ncbi:MAG: MFS transporter [Rhodospirillaceae bacterium]|nr:MFS transporter [Rhodospirillaceae bacterium]|tara:strand:- start:7148 stop:8398 length:1251 start_codon:yes stop_codon:yes gene_type:complete